MTPRLPTRLVLAVLCLTLAACGDDAGTCPPGAVAAEGRCIEPADAGRDAGDASDDASDAADGGSCPMTCTLPEVCDPERGECVRCVEDTDCNAAAPACNAAGECVSCEGDDSLCMRFMSTPLCGSADGACVACNEALDCPNADMPRCDPTTHTCAPCTSDLDCTGPDQNICLTEEPDAGTCVECTPATEVADCAGTSCDPEARTCTETPTGLTRECRTCLADSECLPNHYCIPLEYAGAPHGSYCLKDATAGGCPQPLSISLTGRTSRSGREGGRYCGLVETLTTCEAVRALLANQACSVDPPMPCPEGGLCRPVGDLVGLRCTYQCEGAAQCGASPGDTCGDGPDDDSVDYCGGDPAM